MAASSIEPDPVRLAELASVTSSVLAAGQGGEGAAVTGEASKVLEKVIQLSAENGGAEEQVASAVLGAVNTVQGTSNEEANLLLDQLGASMEEALPEDNKSSFIEAKTEAMTLLVASAEAPIVAERSIDVSNQQVVRATTGHAKWFDSLPLPQELDFLPTQPPVLELSLPTLKFKADVRTPNEHYLRCQQFFGNHKKYSTMPPGSQVQLAFQA